MSDSVFKTCSYVAYADTQQLLVHYYCYTIMISINTLHVGASLKSQHKKMANSVALFCPFFYSWFDLTEF